ncbi:MAG: L,D-transpeptidase family protein [Mogibacterium sp.]|nr:L,D-transpeptidase family protein [Mogibacterium sp.]
MKKRTISMLLVLLMVLSTAGTCVFADVDEPQAEGSTAVTGADVDNGGEEIIDNKVSSEPKAAISGFTATATKGGTDSASVNWSPVPEDVDYDVVVTPIKGGEEQTSLAKSVRNASSTDISGLSEGTTYKFKVVLTYIDGEYEETLTAETGEITTDKTKIVPGKPTLKTYSAYNSVALEWSGDSKASYYNVYMDGKPVNGRIKAKSVFDSSKFAYICGGINDDNNHWFQIEAVSSDGVVTKSDIVPDMRVSRMYIRITFKQKKTLKSHDGTNTKYTFKKGQSVNAFGFGSGQYYFTYPVNGKDRTFYVNYGRVRKPTALYTKSFNYDEREAEYFVLTSGKGSSTSRLIWANLYTQHIYLFTKVNGLWRVNGGTYSHWECSSGKASSPSPTGLSFTIKNKYKRHSSTRFWNTYKGQAAIHGQVNNTYGKPLSHGCIRNPNAKAEFIFKYYPKKTRVMVY